MEKYVIGEDKRHGVTANGKPAAYYIETAIVYAQNSGLITFEDYFVVRNALFELFGVSRQYSERVYRYNGGIKLSEAIEPLTAIGASIGLCGSSNYEREQLGSKIMGVLTPRQSEVSREFRERLSHSPIGATDWFFDFSKATGYIKEGSSIIWEAETDFGNLQITINLAKPEKDPRAIAAEGQRSGSVKGEYPKCLLCPQTAGYAGKPGFPNRQNHRPVRIKGLGGSSRVWYLQYSPYQYYNEHCILLYENHVPMKIDERTFETLFDFIEMFPHYFIGSNADLPIVGGSILSHEHYQGGRHVFPMQFAKDILAFRTDGLDVRASIINWPLSTVRLTGTDRRGLSCAAVHIMEAWKGYDDGVILPFTRQKSDKGETLIPHSTVTPILRRGSDSIYELDIVLRNNLISAEHPLGIYHPHSDVWHIKKENIGLIEVMGLAVLPARLDEETHKISLVLKGQLSGFEGDESDAFYAQNPELLCHKEWITFLARKYGTANTAHRTREIIEAEIGNKFARVLSDCGVFGVEGAGLKRFISFLEYGGWKQAGQ